MYGLLMRVAVAIWYTQVRSVPSMYILGGGGSVTTDINVDEKACAETIDKWMSVLSYAPAESNRIVCSMWPAMRTFGSWHLLLW